VSVLRPSGAAGTDPPLCHLPSPLLPASRLARRLGVARLFIKRDDLLGRLLGGNKLRKLDHICEDARRLGADCLVTEGAVESNHASLTSVVGALLGMPVHLLLLGARDAPHAAIQRRIQSLAGAEVRLIEYDPGSRESVVAARLAVREAVDAVVGELRAQGRNPYVIPEGGGGPRGSYAFVEAFRELHAQMCAWRHPRYEIFLAAGSGSTYAGLLCGASRLGAEVVVNGVSIAHPAKRLSMQVAKAAAAVCADRGWEVPPRESVCINDTLIGDGYGVESRAAREAIEEVFRCEGILLDGTYTGKAMAGLFDAVRRQPRDVPVVFWHTGGVPSAVERLLRADAGDGTPGERGDD